MKKYKLTEETLSRFGKTLYRIEAVRDFGDVKDGEKGGYIQSEDNLSHDGNCWVCDNARVSGNARVCDNAEIGSDADYVCLKGFGS